MTGGSGGRIGYSYSRRQRELQKEDATADKLRILGKLIRLGFEEECENVNDAQKTLADLRNPDERAKKALAEIAASIGEDAAAVRLFILEALTDITYKLPEKIDEEAVLAAGERGAKDEDPSGTAVPQEPLDANTTTVRRTLLRSIAPRSTLDVVILLEENSSIRTAEELVAFVAVYPGSIEKLVEDKRPQWELLFSVARASVPPDMLTELEKPSTDNPPPGAVLEDGKSPTSDPAGNIVLPTGDGMRE